LNHGVNPYAATMQVFVGWGRRIFTLLCKAVQSTRHYHLFSCVLHVKFYIFLQVGSTGFCKVWCTVYFYFPSILWIVIHYMLLNVLQITGVHRMILLKIIISGGFAGIFYLEGGDSTFHHISTYPQAYTLLYFRTL
jgi:hypothetical protein